MRATLVWIIVIFAASLSWAGSNRTHATAFVHINVVPMDREIVLPDQTVVVQEGRITAFGPVHSVRIPADAYRIDGKGRYLMPGLVDMHVHFIRPAVDGQFQASTSEKFEEENRVLALLYIANGVTTVRNMWGHPAIDAFAKETDSRRVLGPHVYSTGPITDGSPVQWQGSRAVGTVEQAQAAVLSDKRAGYVGIKVYDGLSKAAYEAIVKSAREQHIPVVGHIPYAVGLTGVLAAHQDSIEHIYMLLDELQSHPAKDPGSVEELKQQTDLSKMPELARSISAAGIWYCPTTVANARPWTDPPWLKQERSVPRGIVERYQKAYSDSDEDPTTSPDARQIYLAMIRELHKNGVYLLLGTDAYKPGTLPGFSVHEELLNFVEGGLSPYEALRAGTADAARFLRREEEFGTVAIGRRADLLLLNANPLIDVENVKKRVGVMGQGVWLSEEELQSRLRNSGR